MAFYYHPLENDDSATVIRMPIQAGAIDLPSCEDSTFITSTIIKIDTLIGYNFCFSVRIDCDNNPKISSG